MPAITTTMSTTPSMLTGFHMKKAHLSLPCRGPRAQDWDEP
jgi:hypothetical protein